MRRVSSPPSRPIKLLVTRARSVLNTSRKIFLPCSFYDRSVDCCQVPLVQSSCEDSAHRHRLDQSNRQDFCLTCFKASQRLMGEGVQLFRDLEDQRFISTQWAEFGLDGKMKSLRLSCFTSHLINTNPLFRDFWSKAEAFLVTKGLISWQDEIWNESDPSDFHNTQNNVFSWLRVTKPVDAPTCFGWHESKPSTHSRDTGKVEEEVERESRAEQLCCNLSGYQAQSNKKGCIKIY